MSKTRAERVQGYIDDLEMLCNDAFKDRDYEFAVKEVHQMLKFLKYEFSAIRNLIETLNGGALT